MAPQGDDTSRSEMRSVTTRKLHANRRNALKSTGPRSQRGKAYSRQNALKHGLFATNLFSDFLPKTENPQEFKALLDQLWDDYQPVGAAEELEVERIGVCWWRLKRAWRYESAEIDFASSEVAVRAEEVDVRQFMRPELRSLLLLLESAGKEIKEIDGTRTISQELKEKLFAAHPRFREMWPNIQRIATQTAEEISAANEGVSLRLFKKRLSHAPDRQADLEKLIALTTTKLAVRTIESDAKQRFESVLSSVWDQVAIPKSDALDKILRYGGAIERELGRASDRLERLQRRRKGELIPPPLSVRLTR